MPRARIMVVDDEDDGRRFLERELESMGHEVASHRSGEAAIAAIVAGYSPAVAFLDVRMPGTDGLEVLRRLKAACPTAAAVMLSSVSQPDTILDAARLGAARYVAKPLGSAALLQVVRESLEAYDVAQRVQALEQRLERAQALGEMITADPAIARLQEIVRRVADTDVSVLITGESGVGKEIVARLLHQQSARRSHAFIKVNCAAIPHELLESELFGHKKGSFTGAIADQSGKFELAHKGTIFLDEIGDMSPLLQGKLLHVLQDGELCPVGGTTRRVDARVVAATNKPLEDAVRKREFREDLYYRLNVVRLAIPPLRERREDVPLLAQHFLKRYTKQYGQPLRALPEELLAAFARYDWPGNVRELENAIKRHVILPDVAGSLGELGRLTGEPREAPKAPLRETRTLRQVSNAAVESVEKALVLRTLDECAWNRKQAARHLSVSYKSLLNKMKRWDLTSQGWARKGH